MSHLYLDPWIAARIPAADPCAWAIRCANEASADQVIRQREGRTTLRLEIEGRYFFLKLYRGVGWREIFKNLMRLRLPAVGAGREYRAFATLQRSGVDCPRVVACVEHGGNPARRQSFLLTDELAGTVDLQTWCSVWKDQPPPPEFKWKLIECVARIAKTMHDAGIHHRDFYLCHFHLEPHSLRPDCDPQCWLLDLHRAGIRRSLPGGWRVKDLGALYFSALETGLTSRDYLRFIRAYTGHGLRQELEESSHFWKRVRGRAAKMMRRQQRKDRLRV